MVVLDPAVFGQIGLAQADVDELQAQILEDFAASELPW